MIGGGSDRGWWLSRYRQIAAWGTAKGDGGGGGAVQGGKYRSPVAS